MDAIIERCRFIGGTLYCVDISDCTRITVRDCILEPDKHGIYLYHNLTDYGEDKHTIDNVTIVGGVRGIVINGSENNTITNCKFINQTDRPLWIIPTENYQARYNKIEKCRIWRPTGGAACIETQGDYTQIIGNYIFPKDQYGISIVGGTSYKSESTKYCVVKNNHILNGASWGIWLQSAQKNTIMANKIVSTDANSYGIRLIHYGDAPLSQYNKLVNNFIEVTNDKILDSDGNNVICRNTGYVTENSGVATFSGDGSTTDFLIGDHGLAVTDPSKIVVKVTPISSDAIAASPCVGYVDPNDNTKIRVKFASAPASGTDNVKIIWVAQVVG